MSARTSGPGGYLRGLLFSAFIPALMFEIGNGAIAPVIPLSVLSHGGSAVAAGYVLALLGFGKVVGDVPASWLSDRLGDRPAMMLASGVTVAALTACRFAGGLVLFGVGVTGLGMCTAVFYVARVAYVTESVPAQLRARALSTLSGSHRIGLFIGPFLGTAFIAAFGFEAAYFVAMATALVAAVLLFVASDESPVPEASAPVRGVLTVRQLMRANSRLFATLGTAIVALSAVRGLRQTALPLWAEHIGLSPAHISLVLGIANAVDMTLFYPAGRVMDRYGRLAIAMPSAVLLGVGLMMLPLTGTATTFTLVAIVISAGNGIGSGINMTIAADAAPPHDRVRFLSIWRLLGDTGVAGGPLLLAGVANVSALAVGIVSVGPLGLVAAAAMLRWAPRYSPYATPSAIRKRRATAAEP